MEFGKLGVNLFAWEGNFWEEEEGSKLENRGYKVCKRA